MNLAIAIDLSPESRAALKWALDLRQTLRERDEALTCHAIHIPSVSAPFAFQNFTGYGRATDEPGIHHQLVHQVRQFMRDVDYDIDDIQIYVRDGHAPQLISQYCIEHQIDWLITGQSSTGTIGRFFLGSTVDAMAELAPCPIVVVHRDHPHLERPVDISVGIDFLPGSEAALFAAANLADITTGHLCLAHAFQDAPTGALHQGMVNYLMPSSAANMTLATRRALHRMMDEVHQLYPHVTYDISVDHGLPRQVLTEIATHRDSDMLVLGKVHHPTLERLALGSAARQLLHKMPTTLVLAPSESP